MEYVIVSLTKYFNFGLAHCVLWMIVTRASYKDFVEIGILV